MTRNELILKAAIDAGKAIASIKPSKVTVIEKEGRSNYVTLADKTSEQTVFTLIREYFSNDTVLSEETSSHLSERQLLNQEHLWVIDPIDGTVNYQKQMNYSCVSIGYIEKGIPTLAVVYDPFREQLYAAEKGKGAWHNGEKMEVSTTDHLSHSTIITDNSYTPSIVREHLETILCIPETPWILMKGSLALECCEVAAGQADMLFTFCPKPWDIAAGVLLIQEAGGYIADRQGNPANFLTDTFLAGNKDIVKEFVTTVTNHNSSTR